MTDKQWDEIRIAIVNGFYDDARRLIEIVVAEAMAWEREDCIDDMVKAVRARARASRTGGK